MDQTIKERLVGMGVLLVLGVIFIPLILDGNTLDLNANTSQNLNLPVPIEGPTHEMDFTDGNVRRLALPLPGEEEIVSEPETSSKEARLVNSIPTTGFVDELPKEKAVEAVSKNDSSNTQTTVQVMTRTPDGTISRSVSKTSAATAKPKTDSGLQTTTILQKKSATSATSAWVVQIGSFGDRKNAEKEVASLKAKGFPAFLRRFVTSEEKVLYRVRVGPENDRSRAVKLSERLSKAGIRGQIVADP